MVDALPTRILSIGSSCINRFQFEHFMTRHPATAPSFVRGLFDWNIASLDATLNIMRLATEGALEEILADPDRYYVGWDALILNTGLPGFSFFHETDPAITLKHAARRSAFLGKVAHLSAPFTFAVSAAHTHLVWSNVQPNLPDTVENVFPWEAFRLTRERYTLARKLGRQIFGQQTTFSFITTREDVEMAVTEHADVHVLDIRRDETYEGPPLLYEEMLNGILRP
ncbi:hypothetical protein [Marivita sp. S2033]|uniref:hypothetical protein n=1 Tax=Marivita sp. S2033 TaxID=3373187 RepID=UPI003981AC67